MANEREAKRNRGLIGVSVAALLLVGGLFFRMSQLQQQARQAGLPRVMQSTVPDLTAQEKAQSVARAEVLRTKWGAWASQHRSELVRMLNAKAGDRAALNAVWNAVPLIPQEMTLQDLCPPGVQPPTPVGFSWIGLNKANASNPKMSPEVNKQIAAGQVGASAELRRQFDMRRDFVIATSLTNKTEIHLWVSGRITQTGRVPAAQKGAMIDKAEAEGRSFTLEDMQTPHQQIEPPYDFLQTAPNQPLSKS